MRYAITYRVPQQSLPRDRWPTVTVHASGTLPYQVRMTGLKSLLRAGQIAGPLTVREEPC
jgi:hypothetical protein